MEHQNVETRSLEAQIANLRGDVSILRGEVSTVSKTMAKLTDAVDKLVEYNFRLLQLEKEIDESRADRKELWAEGETLRESIHAMQIGCAKCSVKTPASWWDSQVAGWASRLAWLAIGAIAVQLIGKVTSG